MSATAQAERLSLEAAYELAVEVADVLNPYVERSEIAGSIRRRAQTIGDIELVVIPKMQTVQVGLFADDVKQISSLDTAITALLATGPDWSLRLDSAGRTRNGPKHKALSFCGFAVDLFIVTPPAQWGPILAIRTGPWFWSKQLVTHQGVPIFHPHTQEKRYGVLPLDMKFVDGALTRGATLDTPEEVDVFDAIGIPYLEPWKRR